MLRNPTNEEFDILDCPFPAHFGTAVISPFLVIRVKDLPRNHGR